LLLIAIIWYNYIEQFTSHFQGVSMENQIKLLVAQVKERCVLIERLNARVNSINLMFSDYNKFQVEYAKEQELEDASDL
jgi:hypothetical protein